MFIKRILPSILKKRIRKHFEQWAHLEGYKHPKTMKPVNFLGFNVSPLEALERAGNNKVLISVPIGKCRGLGPMAFAFDSSCHPLVLTAKEYLINKRIDYLNSPLEKFYNNVKPKSAAEFLGIDDQNGFLSSLEPLEGQFPWRSACGSDAKYTRISIMEGEAKQYGLDLVGNEGWTEMGPVSTGKGLLEIERLKRLVYSISKNGFYSESFQDYVTGTVLCKKKDQFVVVIRAGQHRTSALVALGYLAVPVVIEPKDIILRDTAFQWPGVINKDYTLKQAIEVFDRVFEGRQPECLKGKWPDVINQIK